MEEKDDFNNTPLYEDVKRVHRIGEREYIIEPLISKDPNWISLEEVCKELNFSKSHIYKISSEKELNWDKKYNMINGNLVAFVNRKEIENYKRSRGKGNVLEPNFTESIISTSKEDSTKPGQNQDILEDKPEEINLPATVNKQIEQKVGEILKSVVQKELSDINQNLQNELVQINKKVDLVVNKGDGSSWRIFAFIFLALFLSAVGILFYSYNNFTKRSLEMSTALDNEKQMFYQTNSVLQSKDTEIDFLKKQTPDVTTKNQINQAI